MTTPADAARESARQADGKFGTQVKDESTLDLTAPATMGDSAGWEKVILFSQAVERRRDEWQTMIAIRDAATLAETCPEASSAVIEWDQGDEESPRVFLYDRDGVKVEELEAQTGLFADVPESLRLEPGPIYRNIVELSRARALDWDAEARRYADDVRRLAESISPDPRITAMENLANTAYVNDGRVDAEDLMSALHVGSGSDGTCPRCGSPADAPDPTCSACPESDRVACYAGDCTYIASDDADLDRHVSEDCEYQSD